MLRGVVEAVEDVLRAKLRECFAKDIHVVHSAPTERRLTGHRRAVSVALFRLAGTRGRPRAGLIVSTWAARAEEEHELLGVAHDLLSSLGALDIGGRRATVRLHESHDFDLLHRFWSSHEHPLRPALVLDVEVGLGAGA